jgi:hypothetical protein
MKSRPRSVEREVAKHLSEYFIKKGGSPVHRIPILGRTGPDISINEFGWVIDVKSRLQVPQHFITPGMFIYANLFSVPLETLEKETTVWKADKGEPSVLVKRWFDHMDEWTKENCPMGLTMLVLHRPKLPIGKSVIITKVSEMERLICPKKMLSFNSAQAKILVFQQPCSA